MFKTSRILSVATALLTFAVASSPTAALADAADPFPGAWDLQASPDETAASDGQRPFRESVLFHNMEFSASAFAMLGFSPATYTVSSEGPRSVFTVTLTSSDRGTVTWRGRESGDSLTGTLTWNRADGKVYTYAISATRS